MIDSQITEKINQAKDQFGVVSPDSAYKQLGSFTEADWQEASKLFSQDPAKPDGFSIVDKDGSVTIHNDMSQANLIANTSVSDLTFEDGSTIVNYAIGAYSAGVALAGLGATAYEASVSGLATEGLVDAGFEVGATTAVFGGFVTSACVGAVLAGDVVRNVIRQGGAQEDVTNNSVVPVQGPRSTSA